MSMRHCIVGLILSICASTPLAAQTPDIEFFEAKIRPVLAQKCYGCHNSKMPAPKGNLVLDSKEGLLKGGVSGPAIVPGKPAESRLITALSYSDPLAQMPPSGKLPEAVLADFEQWIARGAADPRATAPAMAAAAPQYKGHVARRGPQVVGVPTGRRPCLRPRQRPRMAGRKTKIDNFVLAKLQEKKLAPSPQADRAHAGDACLCRSARLQADLRRSSGVHQRPDRRTRTSRLIDRLLASPHYGERWARRWMDVARYAEDNPTSEATNPPYPFAWRYRDWIIEALNAGMPYDRFIKLQLAADLMPGTTRADMRALGYVGAAPVYHTDRRLSGEVIGGLVTDDWDDRIDAVSRGVLGISAACARCHDHKFDPITQKDYAALMGVFASTLRAERPMFAVDPKVEQRYMWLQRQLFDLAYSINLLGNEGTTFTNGAEKASEVDSRDGGVQSGSDGAAREIPSAVAEPR